MKRAGKYWRAVCWLCFAVWLWGSSSALAAERTYPVREAELTQLARDLEQLSRVNDGQRTRLIGLQEALQRSEEKLRASEKSSEELGRRLERLSGELTGRQNSLENAKIVC